MHHNSFDYFYIYIYTFIHTYTYTLSHLYCWYKHISVHATMKHLNSLTQVNLTTLLGQTLHFIGFEELSQVEHKLQQTTSDDPGRQHSLWSTHIVLFLDAAPSCKQKSSNSCMAFPCCQQKWSVPPLRMK